jgi:hypothetical protein
LYADLSVIDMLFPMLTADELEQLKGYFREHQNIEVVHNFPRRGATVPVIALSLAAESEDGTKDTLGYFIDELTNSMGLEVDEVRGIAMRSTYNVMVFTQDRDFTIHFYNILKAIMLLNIDTLAGIGMHDIQFSGNDFRFEDDSYFPTFVYSRMLTISALHYDVVLQTSKMLQKLVFSLRVGSTASIDEDTIVSQSEL